MQGARPPPPAQMAGRRALIGAGIGRFERRFPAGDGMRRRPPFAAAAGARSAPPAAAQQSLP